MQSREDATLRAFWTRSVFAWREHRSTLDVRCWTFAFCNRFFISAFNFQLSVFNPSPSSPAVLLAQGGGDLNPALKTPQEPLQRWRSLRVGAFIHWSPWVVPGANSIHEFRAEKFDPRQWVALFHEAGFKYVVFTTKHGDAVCMWDTKETTRNVMNTPLHRDVVGELVAECRKGGVEFCPYYAIENFLHPDWTNDLDPVTGKPVFKVRKKTRWSENELDGSPYFLPANSEPDFERYIAHSRHR